MKLNRSFFKWLVILLLIIHLLMFYNKIYSFLTNNDQNNEIPYIKYLVCVVNRNKDSTKRSIIRQLWLNPRIVGRKDFMLKFFIGSSPDEQSQTLILKENTVHGDIVFLNSIEKYELLMEKTLQLFKWFIDESNHVNYLNIKYLIKVDDDFVLFIDNLLSTLDLMDVEYYGNKVMYQPVVRSKTSRYYVDPAIYSEKYFKPYASGACYVLSKKAVFDIYAASLKIEHFSNEDAFVGYLAYKSNIKLTSDSRFATFSTLTDDSVSYVCRKRNLFGIHYSNKISLNRQQLFYYRFIHKNIIC